MGAIFPSTRWRCGPRLTLLTALLLSVPATALAQTDRIFTTDGQVLAGRLANPTIAFDTPYGRIAVPNAAVRKIERHKEVAHSELLMTVNDERITGFLASDHLQLRVTAGPQLDVRKELIQSVVVAVRQKPLIRANDYFLMQNGDVFYGTVLDASFELTTAYGRHSTSFADLLRIEDMGNGQTRLHLSDGNRVQGFIATDFIRVKTNYDFELRIPKSSIKVIQLRR